ncbi:MAG: malectin domain-containing carbohydrate-binding protein, partial [Cyanobacteria bacterium P01_D01_bin.105]
ADDVDLDAATLDGDELLVTDGAGTPLAVTFVGVVGSVATYEVVPSDGDWDSADSGTYSVSIVAGSVTDIAGNDIAATPLGSFDVTIAAPDTTAPTGALSQPLVDIPAETTTPQTIEVTYADDVDLDAATLDGDELLVTDGAGTPLAVTFVGVVGSVATYEVVPSDGDWDSADSGTYSVSIVAGSVTDIAGNDIAATPLGSFDVTIAAPDTTAPTGALSQPLVDITAETTTPQTIEVTFADDVDLDATTLDGDELLVTDSTGTPLAVTFVGVVGSVATYEVVPSDGDWDSADSGTYSVSIVAGSVSDAAGNDIAATALGSFDVTIAAPDTTAPTGALSQPLVDITAETTTPQTIEVTYADDVDLDATTLDGDELLVTDSTGTPLAVTFVGVVGSVATYEVIPSDGDWDSADSGTYSVSVVAGSVTDVAGNDIVATPLGSFDVTIAAPDTTAPTGTLSQPLVDITAETTAPQTIEVTFADDVELDAATLDGDELLVTDASGTPLVVTFVSAVGSVATYEVAPPGGGWDSVDSGTYSVSVVAGSVTDAAGNDIVATPLGSFDVTIAPPDTTAPTGSLSQPLADIIAETTAPQVIEVTFADDVELDATTLDGDELLVTDSTGSPLAVTFVSAVGSVATYEVAPPGGGWDNADSGTYSVSVVAGSVADAAGNDIAATPLGTFDVAIADTTAPTGSLSQPLADITSLTIAPQVVEVNFADDIDLDATTLDGDELLVTDVTGTPLSVTFVGAVGSVATYEVAPPGGGWDSVDSGTYSVSVVAGSVADVAGNDIAATPLGSFDVSIVNTVLYRVNAGGQEVAAIDGGLNWSADTMDINSLFLTEAGSNATATFIDVVTGGSTVPDTTPNDIFATERWDSVNAPGMTWAFNTPDVGEYEVRLFMGNGYIFTSNPGERVFDVAIEGVVPTNLNNVDLSGQFGHLVGGMISNTVMVTDGTLNIEFSHEVENPLINGIEIIKVG